MNIRSHVCKVWGRNQSCIQKYVTRSVYCVTWSLLAICALLNTWRPLWTTWGLVVNKKTALCCNAIHNSVFFLFSSLDTLLSLFIYLLLKFICYSARLQLKKKESVQWKTVPEHVNALTRNILIKLKIQIVSVATIIHSNSVKWILLKGK